MSVNWRKSVFAATAAAGFAATAGACFADEPGKRVPPPAPMPADRPSPPPAPKPAVRPAAENGDLNKVLDDLISEGRKASNAAPAVDVDALQQKTADDRREGLIAYQQAVAAAQANKPAEALRLAKKANSLFPHNPDITTFLASVQREANASKIASTSVIRARAMVAAAANRGAELMRAQRYAEGEDLLLGVIAASRLFADPSSVDPYRRLAEKSIEQYRSDVRDGAASAETASAASAIPQTQPKLALAGSQPPENVRRLLRSAEGLVPAWYTHQKALLSKPISVDYRRTPVAVALDDLAEKTGLTFVVDRPVALARTHINALLDLRVSDLSAESILDLACQKADIEYVVMERSIVITTRAKALEYVRQLPEALRYNWAVGKVLFPDVHPELFATENNVAPPTDVVVRSRLADRDVPMHLRSGNALVMAVQNLLKK